MTVMRSNIVFLCCLFFLLTQTYAQQPDPLASEQQQQGIERDAVADDETAEVQEDDGGDVVVDKRYHRYEVVTRNENWWGAQQTCKGMGGDLVVIDDDHEHNRVISLLPPKKDKRWNKVCRRHWHLPGMSFWTAGQRENQNDKHSRFVWKTLSGNKEMYYSRWNRGEPNNFGGVESCMQLSRTYGYNWNDAKCDVGFCFICEFY